MKVSSLKRVTMLCGVAIAAVLVAAPATPAAAPTAVCVPWYAANPAVPHDTWSGRQITLKGVARGADGGALTYVWDFGDGSPVASGGVGDPFIVEATHTYTGNIGDLFVATLTVTDAEGGSDSDSYLVQIRDGARLDVQVNVAIDEGLWRLHKDMVRGTYPDGADYGYYPYGSNSAAATGACVQAFEVHGHLPDGSASEDPYVETVQRGLNFLLANTHVEAISPQPAGDPDSNGNGIGLGCYTEWRHSMYECGITLMTFASSNAPGRIAATGDPTYVKGRTYREIVRDIVDFVAFGQSDADWARGGWRYWANYGNSDNSCSQWPVIGMEAAETTFAISPPAFVKSELSIWIDYIQNDVSGGSGYSSPGEWVNIPKTGGLLCEMKFCGDSSGTARALAAWNFIGTYWDTDYEHLGSLYAMYSVMKGFRLMGIGSLPDGTDWYADPSRGYAVMLVSWQDSAGGWTGGDMWSSHPLSSAWALLTLQPTVVEPGPIADAGPDVSNHPPVIEVVFDGSGSHHLDPARKIVLYEWDFEGDGVYDASSPEPTVSHGFPAVYHPDGSIDWAATAKDYTVTLRVTDDNASPKRDTDTCTVHITAPPWPPVGKNETITLDACDSYAPGGRLYPDPSHPWYGKLVSWEWDLDNDGAYDDASGETVPWSSDVKGLYVIGLRVTDNLGATDAEDTVINVANRPPVADAGGLYCCAEGEVTFDASGSIDPDPGETATLQYRWDFDGDGAYDTDWSSDPSAKHTYPVCQEYLATLEVRDVEGATDTDTAKVVRNQPPDCSGAATDVVFLWPPNHKMVPVSILGVTDPDGDPVTITITGITSDEPTASDPGSGGAKHAPDAGGVGTDIAQLRAECSGTANGRVYEVSFQASDDKGAVCQGSVKIFVPHDMDTGDGPVDDGQNYDATQIN